MSVRRSDGLARGRRTSGDGEAHRDARLELARWLVAGRDASGLTPEQVAQTTRIQLRTIERLETGRFDELPADVFVRGFIRGYARCCGLSVDEALARYGLCGFAAAPVASAQAHALLESMASLAPSVVRPGPTPRAPRILGDGPAAGEGGDQVGLAARLAAGSLVDVVGVGAAATSAAQIDPPVSAAAVSGAAVSGAAVSGAAERATVAAPAVDAVDPGPRPRRTTKTLAPAAGPAVRDSRGRFIRRTGMMTAEVPVVDVGALGLEAEVAALEASSPAAAPTSDAPLASLPEPVAWSSRAPASALVEVEVDTVDVRPVVTATAIRLTGRTIVSPPRVSAITVAPTLVIDDDDPEDADRAREAREAPRKEADKGWRSFLPPALLDQQKGRQGGLTLAVIILLIVATLTLSYLMRRPSSSGDGITAAPDAAHLVG